MAKVRKCESNKICFFFIFFFFFIFLLVLNSKPYLSLLLWFWPCPIIMPYCVYRLMPIPIQNWCAFIRQLGIVNVKSILFPQEFDAFINIQRQLLWNGTGNLQSICPESEQFILKVFGFLISDASLFVYLVDRKGNCLRHCVSCSWDTQTVNAMKKYGYEWTFWLKCAPVMFKRLYAFVWIVNSMIHIHQCIQIFNGKLIQVFELLSFSNSCNKRSGIQHNTNWKKAIYNVCV